MFKCSVCGREYSDWRHYQKCRCKCGAGIYGVNKQEAKMTRQEAIEKFKTASGNLYGEPIVDGLEALGLLKFEDEVDILNKYVDMSNMGSSTAIALKAFLVREGYKIVRNKD